MVMYKEEVVSGMLLGVGQCEHSQGTRFGLQKKKTLNFTIFIKVKTMQLSSSAAENMALSDGALTALRKLFINKQKKKRSKMLLQL